MSIWSHFCEVINIKVKNNNNEKFRTYSETLYGVESQNNLIFKLKSIYTFWYYRVFIVFCISFKITQKLLVKKKKVLLVKLKSIACFLKRTGY